jgi:hypothetical protein
LFDALNDLKEQTKVEQVPVELNEKGQPVSAVEDV